MTYMTRHYLLPELDGINLGTNKTCSWQVAILFLMAAPNAAEMAGTVAKLFHCSLHACQCE